MKKIFLLLISLFALAGCAEEKSTNEEIPVNTVTETTETTDTTVTTATTNSTALTTKTTESFYTAVLKTTEKPETIQTTTVSDMPVVEDGRLVKIIDYIPDAVIDLRYATTNNFTGVVLYDDSDAYLCYGAVKKLIEVQKELKEKGFRILIWDAYRPPEAQKKLWEVYPDPNFVADPRNGLTSHSRGGTVDISIVYEDGSPVELPSEFDEFSATADRDYSDVSEKARENALMFQEIMYRNGFKGYSGEWWDYTDIDSYTVIFDNE